MLLNDFEKSACTRPSETWPMDPNRLVPISALACDASLLMPSIVLLMKPSSFSAAALTARANVAPNMAGRSFHTFDTAR
jgi:hypothetical protein